MSPAYVDSFFRKPATKNYYTCNKKSLHLQKQFFALKKIFSSLK